MFGFEIAILQKMTVIYGAFTKSKALTKNYALLVASKNLVKVLNGIQLQREPNSTFSILDAWRNVCMYVCM